MSFLTTLAGAAKSKTIAFNVAAAVLGCAPVLFGDNSIVQSVVGVLPANWQVYAVPLAAVANMILRAQTTQSLADKAAS